MDKRRIFQVIPFRCCLRSSLISLASTRFHSSFFSLSPFPLPFNHFRKGFLPAEDPSFVSLVCISGCDSQCCQQRKEIRFLCFLKFLKNGLTLPVNPSLLRTSLLDQVTALRRMMEANSDVLFLLFCIEVRDVCSY